MKDRIEVLRQSGCLDFTKAAAARVLREIEEERPAAAALLTDEARDCLQRNCEKRLELLYAQALAQELRERAAERDPVSAMLGSTDDSLEEQLAAELAQSGRAETLLHTRYPLAAEYAAHILPNFRTSWIEFFDALTACREEISQRLLGGKPFTKIERFSDFGGDQHRHGRAVTGVWTDGGVFYYKPHDCGLDMVYREIVERWFSDCTVAAEVVQINNVAFVSRLRRASVDTESAVADYYYHFGVLTALLHGLGSIDMHLENIMACGDRPAVIDLETLITPSFEKQARNKQLEPSAHALGQSVYRIGILPVRMYGKPLFSPLYSERPGAACLPLLDGKTHTVQGYEGRFAAGFRDGYGRVLAHREEIKALLRARGGATVRILMRNTMFYALIQQSLYRPETLQSRAQQEKILHRLALPFEQIGAETFREQVDHEAACLRLGDIPYFCTSLESTDLCGEDTEQLVKEGYFSDSPLGMTEKSLDRLSEAELRCEEDIIRIAFAHAPLDAPKQLPPAPIAGAPVPREDARAAAVSLFRALLTDRMYTPAGQPFWLSTAITLHGLRPFGPMGGHAEAGAFCAALLRTRALSSLHAEALEIAQQCVRPIADSLSSLSKLNEELLENAPRLPMGLYNGCGGVLWGLAAMERAGVPQARETAERLLPVLTEFSPYWHEDPSLSEGLAGLTVGLAELPFSSPEREACLRLCAGKLLAADVPEIPDLFKGAAGLAVALTAAHKALGDSRCAEKVSAILAQLRRDYRDDLHGWPDSAAKLRWMADRGRQAAGIALAADYIAERLPEQAAAQPLRDTALSSLLEEKELGRFDTLYEGNALAVLCLLRTGSTARAGQVLGAMLARADREGSFLVSDPGIRSFFDPSLWVGSLGVGLAASEYLRTPELGGNNI